tara:strand:- start:95 stop:202 length:108 start_codon:yes stop_codon:yes gene_type:complete
MSPTLIKLERIIPEKKEIEKNGLSQQMQNLKIFEC